MDFSSTNSNTSGRPKVAAPTARPPRAKVGAPAPRPQGHKIGAPAPGKAIGQNRISAPDRWVSLDLLLRCFYQVASCLIVVALQTQTQLIAFALHFSFITVNIWLLILYFFLLFSNVFCLQFVQLTIFCCLLLLATPLEIAALFCLTVSRLW